ncbi:MAG: type II toxin-antitoxin system VapC family toxin [Cyanosarcina radialis HA8281-LM2]|jgi:PIN domain nuclease of toxin-antitoxin system|nr:type II toxin-antitoxin system VapC family toxin [Cyanosarcina radialis HA8281-LM2]
MRILLDTHIFLWFITGNPQLSTNVRDAIRDPDNEVYLSVVSVWEVIVKYQLGKLQNNLTIATVEPAVCAYSVNVI